MLLEIMLCKDKYLPVVCTALLLRPLLQAVRWQEVKADQQQTGAPVPFPVL